METVTLEPFTFKLSISQLLSTLIFMRTTNQIPETHFTLVPVSDRKQKVFKGVHQVPPMLKMILKKKIILLDETINYENLPHGFTVVSVSTNKDPNVIPYMQTTSTYSCVEGGVECRTIIHMKLFKTPLPKFMKKQFQKVAEKKADKFREIETRLALENF